MRKRILSLVLVMILSVSFMVSPKETYASDFLSDEMAQQFVDLFYSAGSLVAEDVKSLLKGEDIKDEERRKNALESANSKIAFFASALTKSEITSSQLISDIANTTNFAKNIISVYKNTKNVADFFSGENDDASAIDKFSTIIDGMSGISSALSLIGAPIPASIKLILKVTDLSLDFVDKLQKAQLPIIWNDYKIAVEFSLAINNSILTPEEYKEDRLGAFYLNKGKLSNENRELVEAMITAIYLEYEFEYKKSKYFNKIEEYPPIESEQPETSENKCYTITFNSNCDDVDDYIYTYSSEEDNWHVPTMSRDGYIFCGWYYDSACTKSASGTISVDSDKTFYAKWQKRGAVITLDSNCSYMPNKTIDIDLLKNEVEYIPEFTRSGYIFGGWYLDKACTNKVSGELKVTEDLTLYAKWHPRFRFTKSNGKITITGMKNYSDKNGEPDGNISIPSIMDSCTVTKIETSCFENNDIITSINIPYSVKSIGEYAFKNCRNLKKIYWGTGIEEVGDYAFEGCNNVESIYINDLAAWCKVDFSDNPIGEETKLYVNGSVLTDLTVPEGVETIGKRAFNGYKFLDSVTIPATVESVGNYAFSECSDVNSLIIEDGVMNIGNGAFSEMAIETLEIPGSVKCVNGFYGCEKLKTAIFNEGIEEIGLMAFENCYNLESVVLPESLKTIKMGAFWGCHNLKDIKLPDSLEKIETCAFYGSLNVDEFSIPGSVKLGELAFEEAGFRHLILNEGITEIPLRTFECCFVESIDLPQSLEIICDEAFLHGWSLKTIKIGPNVKSIGNRVFYECFSLTDINVSENNAYYSSDERGVLFNKNKTSLIQYPVGNTATSYEIPDGVERIEYKAFDYSNLKEIKIPRSVTNIAGAFLGCENLDTVYYNGLKRDWNKILIDSPELIQATLITDNLISYEANGGTGAPGEQIKKYKESITLSSEIPTRKGYEFSGWSENISEEVKFNPGDTYTANEDITLYAVWKEKVGGSTDTEEPTPDTPEPEEPATPAYTSTITATTGGYVTRDGKPVSGNIETASGEVITLTAVAEEGAEFKGWINGTTKKLLSTKSTYTYNSYASNNIIALFADSSMEDEVFISFLTRNNQFAFYSYVPKGTDTTSYAPSPEKMYSTGYTFENFSPETGVVEVNTDYKGVYEKEANKYVITVVNGTDKKGQDSFTATYNQSCTVVPSDAPEGLSFAGWKINGKLTSYDSEYTFYAFSDMELEAVFAESVEEKPLITMIAELKSVSGETPVASFLAANYLPEGYTYIDSGMVYVKTEAGSIDLTLENEGKELYGKVIKRSPASNGSSMFRLSASYKESGITARAYLIYLDEKGERKVIYTDAFFVTDNETIFDGEIDEDIDMD